MEIIYYEVKGFSCETKCPYSQTGVIVGSDGCLDCDYHEYDNEKFKYVKCNYKEFKRFTIFGKEVLA